MKENSTEWFIYQAKKRIAERETIQRQSIKEHNDIKEAYLLKKELLEKEQDKQKKEITFVKETIDNNVIKDTQDILQKEKELDFHKKLQKEIESAQKRSKTLYKERTGISKEQKDLIDEYKKNNTFVLFDQKTEKIEKVSMSSIELKPVSSEDIALFKKTDFGRVTYNFLEHLKGHRLLSDSLMYYKNNKLRRYEKDNKDNPFIYFCYIIKCLDTGYVYIGETINWIDRIYDYIGKNIDSANTNLAQDIKLYGLDRFEYYLYPVSDGLLAQNKKMEEARLKGILYYNIKNYDTAIKKKNIKK